MKTKTKLRIVATLVPLPLAFVYFRGEISSLPDAIGAVVATYLLLGIPALFFFFLNSSKSAPPVLAGGSHNGPDLYLNVNNHEVHAFNDGESIKINNF